VHSDARVAKLALRTKGQIFEGPLEVVKPWKEPSFRLQWLYNICA
jgi:hypothetical protein